MPKVFVTMQSEFCPDRCPVVGFSDEWRIKPLVEAEHGDRIVIIITKSSKDDIKNRGCILGMATFHPKEVNGKDFIDENDTRFKGYYKGEGEHREYRWPHAVKMNKAWKIDNPPQAKDKIKMKLGQPLGSQVAELDKEDADEVLKLFEENGVEVPVGDKVNNVGDSPIENVGDKKDTRAKGPTRGPVPPLHPSLVISERNAEGLAYVYAFRFGNSDIWKIGWAKDVRKRLNDVNKHVPHEILKQEWQEYFFEEYDNQQLAYATEQALLDLLKDKRTHGERVQCTEQELQNAWKQIK